MFSKTLRSCEQSRMGQKTELHPDHLRLQPGCEDSDGGRCSHMSVSAGLGPTGTTGLTLTWPPPTPHCCLLQETWAPAAARVHVHTVTGLSDLWPRTWHLPVSPEIWPVPGVQRDPAHCDLQPCQWSGAWYHSWYQFRWVEVWGGLTFFVISFLYQYMY